MDTNTKYELIISKAIGYSNKQDILKHTITLRADTLDDLLHAASKVAAKEDNHKYIITCGILDEQNNKLRKTSVITSGRLWDILE